MHSDALASLETEEFHDPSEALCIRTGRNLRRLRTRRGYSLDRLAKVSGVSRAMLGQIETGKSSPTLNVLAKIAAALEVSCGSLNIEEDEPTTVLLTRAASKTLSSSDGRFETTAKVTLEPDGDGFKVTRSDLELTADVPGIDEDKLRALAEDAKKNCPVSKLLNADMDLTVHAGAPAAA